MNEATEMKERKVLLFIASLGTVYWRYNCATEWAQVTDSLTARTYNATSVERKRLRGGDDYNGRAYLTCTKESE